ncbi:MAG: hypothetical protein RQ754_03530 [Desulfuromonadales bacterium]|nr:hypothetical protein [Desulfuromonadales bacterium]
MAENLAPPKISPLFLSRFTVDSAAPFERHLNRLEVEIGREDYAGLKRVERIDPSPPPTFFAGMEDLTGRLLKTTQNNYNRELLKRMEISVRLDVPRYHVYYHWPGCCLRFVPVWRERVLQLFFHDLPLVDLDWRDCGSVLPGFRCRFVADGAGGSLLLENSSLSPALPLLTVSHGPYDPHTLDVALYFLRSGRGRAALINLGFSGREPLSDGNLQRLKEWGLPLNPSNIDVIYPYVDAGGHPYCYKQEEGLPRFVGYLNGAEPDLILDLHGYVGTHAEDRRVLVGLGGLPPYPRAAELGRLSERGGVFHLLPAGRLRRGLKMVRELSEEIYVQFCEDAHRAYHFAVLGGLQLIGRSFDPRDEIASLLEGEERHYLPADNVRWLPSAGANAVQRINAGHLFSRPQCLHVEIPTWVRRRIALRMREQAITDSLESSGL